MNENPDQDAMTVETLKSYNFIHRPTYNYQIRIRKKKTSKNNNDPPEPQDIEHDKSEKKVRFD